MANLNYYGNLMSAEESARYLGVSYQTILKYVKNGLISATDLSSGTGRPIWGFKEHDLIDFDMRKKKVKDGFKDKKKKAVQIGKAVKKVVERNDMFYIAEITKLKSAIRILSEELLDISVQLDELSK